MTAGYNGGSLVAEVLKREGIKYVFGLAGGHIYPMMEACEERGIRYIGVRHEMSASFMAEGWSLTTGTAGVCIGTAGPGFTNLLTGLANSSSGGFPVLCIAGKAKISESDRNELQDFDQIDMVKHLMKYARSVAEARRIPEYVGRALAYCSTGRPGPVYLEIPQDLMAQNVDIKNIEFQKTYRINERITGDPVAVASAAEMITQSRNPLIIAGGGVWWSQAQGELTKLAEKTDIPVFTRNAARGAISDRHSLCMGIAASASPLFRLALEKSDLALIIGTRTGYTLNREVFPKSLKIIRIDIDPAQITDQLDVELGIIGDAAMVLRQLTDAVKKTSYGEWVNYLTLERNSLLAMAMPMAGSDQYPIHPMRLMFEILQRVDGNTIVVIDGGDVARWGNLVLPALLPGGYPGIISTGFGPLGVGVPYALAAKLAHPGQKVMLLTGDGAFGYGAMEFDTAVRYGLAFTTIILNDRCWGMIKRSEAVRSSGQGFVGLDLIGTRYDKVVEALGGHGEYVDLPQEIGPAIDRAISSGKPACVNVLTDPDIGPFV